MFAPSGNSLLPFPWVSAEPFITVLTSLLMDIIRLLTASTKTAHHVVLCFLFFGMSKKLSSLSCFDHPSLKEEDCFLCNASGLLHVMGHNDNCVCAFKFPDQLFHLKRRFGIKC